MARQGKDDIERKESNKWEPTEQDVAELRAELKNFEQKRIEGKLFSRFEQLMAKRGIIRILEMGVVTVRDPHAYNRLTEIKDVIDRQDYAEHEKILAAFPNKAKEHLDMIKAMGRPSFMPKKMPKVEDEDLTV